MAYDFGANTLGIKNPFKTEGLVKSIAGAAICILGIISLLSVSASLKVDMVSAWVDAVLGLMLLTWGLRHMGVGLFQLFKYFVGRSVPTSLAFNRNKSEKENAKAEQSATAYNANDLESMLMGRKNTTFVEPIGWLARLVHSVFPKLIFMPYQIRNLVQELAGLVTSSLMAIVVFTVAYFVSNSGLVGQAGAIITPVLSLLLLVYMTFVWRSTAKSLTDARNTTLHKHNASSIAFLVVVAFVVPVGLGYLYTLIPDRVIEKTSIAFKDITLFDAWFNLGLLFAVSLVIIAVSWVMVRERFNMGSPTTDVSEYRDNMQESIHPNEIFINIENTVLANRRYKEMPNRIYQEFDPALQEQSQGKGSFKGQLLIETQPEVHEMNYSKSFKACRMLATIFSQGFIVASAFLFTLVVGKGLEFYHLFLETANLRHVNDNQVFAIIGDYNHLLMAFLTLFFSWLAVAAAGRILANGTHLFWSEMQFKSLLMWMKTEGTFTESKISTGMSIHDSTRSENVVVRSSITPWIITSRILSSTFATTGVKNLEMPRFILEMEKNTDEMDSIVAEIKEFLRGREAIASITNEKDLSNAETIYQVNQVSRAHMDNLAGSPSQVSLEEQAAAKLIQEQSDAEENAERLA
ncbi:hypothetical protein FR932_02965 [Moritella marina ATCC 15381]|uniref:Uncharacterized protein n=1 Tax=Moritella marina ATCC 15381 TaxID=1202962 RepID=A0A5J6WI66_MORMI|nr:hypothetical protein [Moritella marina]QFI36871.1 hypothetical protein FR932_02965 [Moritella marina ATCC 15381]